MLFLVRAEVGAVPAEELAGLLERVEQEWRMVLGLARIGRILACGKLRGRRGAVAIFEIESRAALDEVVARLPLAPYFARLEIEPLEHAETALARAERVRQVHDRLRGARRARENGRSGTARATGA